MRPVIKPLETMVLSIKTSNKKTGIHAVYSRLAIGNLDLPHWHYSRSGPSSVQWW